MRIISRVDHNITVGARFPRPYNAINSIENCCIHPDWEQRDTCPNQPQNLFQIKVENPAIWLMNILQTESENDETDGN